jgi:hypothetical protein
MEEMVKIPDFEKIINRHLRVKEQTSSFFLVPVPDCALLGRSYAEEFEKYFRQNLVIKQEVQKTIGEFDKILKDKKYLLVKPAYYRIYTMKVSEYRELNRRIDEIPDPVVKKQERNKLKRDILRVMHEMPVVHEAFSEAQLDLAKKSRDVLLEFGKSLQEKSIESHNWVESGITNMKIGESRIRDSEGSIEAPRFREAIESKIVKRFHCKKCGLLKRDI